MGYRGNLSKVPTVTHRTQVSPLFHSGDRGNLSLEFDVETFAKMGDRGDLCFPSGIQKGPRGNLSPPADRTRWDTVETVYRGDATGQAPIQPQQDTGETDGIPWKPQLPMG